MLTTSPRYSVSVQRDAVEQVLVHHRSIAEVARQLRCSPQSVTNWIDKHHKSPPAFVPLQVAPAPALPSDKIELVTKNGLILRFPASIPAEAFCGIVRQLDIAS